MRTKFLIIFIIFIISCTQENNEINIEKQTENTGYFYNQKTIVFLGDSLTAGYGLNSENAFPSLIQKKIKKHNLDWEVINAGISGDTSKGGLNRLDWIISGDPDIVFISIGSNDALRGIDPEYTKKNIETMINKLQKNNIKVLLAGIKIPPNYGKVYTQKIAGIYKKLADKYNLSLYDFLLEGVGGIPELNQNDGIHPNKKGHKIIADNVFDFIEPYLK